MPAITFSRKMIISCALFNPVALKNPTFVTSQENKIRYAAKRRYSNQLKFMGTK
jgi:hypothetical protein